jgi:hypothetical protein
MESTRVHVWRWSVWVALSLLIAAAGLCQDTRNVPASAQQLAEVRIEQGTLLQIELAQRTNWKHLARNSVVEGRLMLPVFAGTEVAIPERTKVSLTIKSVKRVGNDARTWKKAGSAVVRAFNPLEKGRPSEYEIRVSKTEVDSLQGRLLVATTALRAGNGAMIHPKVKSGEVQSLQSASAKASGSKGRQTVVLRLDEDVQWPAPAVGMIGTANESPTRIARAFLLTQLSASHSRKDDAFQARLAESVRLGDKLFGQGSLVEGKVSRSTGPRMLSRAGSLYLRIDRITSPQGCSMEVAGALGGVESEAGAKYSLDEEGGLHGLKPGVKNALVDLGIAYAVGKVTDDLAETPIRAVGAAMSDAAVANAARYFGLGASAVFLVTRHGRDVYLPRYSEMEIDFGRLSERSRASASLQHPWVP